MKQPVILPIAVFCVALLAFSVRAQTPKSDPSKDLVGTWRIVSYPTSEGDLLKRHGRQPGPIPEPSEPLTGWSYLVFTADGDCGLFMPQRIKDKPSHRRVTWFHDEDNFATWKLDHSKAPWHLDLGSVTTPKFRTVKSLDPNTGKPINRREAVTDPKTGDVEGQRWTYPAVCRIDGSLLTIVWWQNHQLLEKPPEEKRPRPLGGLPDVVVKSLSEKQPLMRDDPRVKIPGGISCFVCQKFSANPLPIPAAPALAEILRK